jgi:hypothetical protein
MKKIWSGIKKFIGVTEEQEAAKKWRPVALQPSGPVHRKFFGRKGWRRLGFPRRPLGAGRRKRRLELIRISQMQGIIIARNRAAAMKKDRDEGGHFFMKAFRRSQRGV